MTKKEKTTEIQLEVPLTKENLIKYSNEFIVALDLASEAESDIKDYIKTRKEDAEQYEVKIAEIRLKIKSSKLTDEERTTLANEIITAMNRLSEIEDDVKSYKTEKQAEIAKCEATMNICRIKINRGKDIQWVKVKELKDYVAKTKTYFNLETGEAVKTLPMNDDDAQLEMDSA